YRGRRRRRGSRRGPNGAEPKFTRPAEVTPRPEREQPREHAREEYGPPAGYQPIILPGESISKYRGKAQPLVATEQAAARTEADPAISHIFEEDEPIFAQPGHEREITQDLPLLIDEPPAH